MMNHPSQNSLPIPDDVNNLEEYVPSNRIITRLPSTDDDDDDDELTDFTEHNRLLDVVSGMELHIPKSLKAFMFDSKVNKLFKPAHRDETKLLTYYLLDAASLLPVIALNLKPSDRVLDLCAGPGGKTLAIAQTLFYKSITSVEMSYSRLSRVKEILSMYIPQNSDGEETFLTICQDGREFGQANECQYDKVLVDVPCSTDRHVLHEEENNLFAKIRMKERLNLPSVQTALLKSGLLACSPGGCVVYSTCTMTPGQNDQVVQAAVSQLQSQSSHQYNIEDLSPVKSLFQHTFNFWSNCRYGQLVLPTLHANFGPTYFAKITKH